MKSLVVLVGMMGVGKTSAGLVLSKVLKYKFIDVDKEIEKQQNKSITVIFNEFGESYFRNLEKEFIKSVANSKNTVLSLGGGAFENIETQNLLKKNGVVIYLKATPLTIFKRIRSEINRPLLNKEFSVDTINFIMKKRVKNYEKAHFIIDTNNKTRKEVVRKILGVL